MKHSLSPLMRMAKKIQAERFTKETANKRQRSMISKWCQLAIQTLKKGGLK